MLELFLENYQIFIGVFLFLMGLSVGSFLNVCIYRIPEEKSIIYPNSGCPNCGYELKFLDLIPVISYIFLRGKCRSCKKPISIQYPIVELFTGIMWVVVYLKFGFTVETAAIISLYTLLIPVTLIDIRYLIIPNQFIIVGLIVGIGFSAYHIFVEPISLYDSAKWYTPFIGMLSSSSILFIMALITLFIYRKSREDGGIGIGDIKLFMVIGLFLGWKLSILILFFSVFIGGIASIFLLVAKKAGRKSEIPFAPYIVIATYIAGFYGYDFINWYFNLLI